MELDAIVIDILVKSILTERLNDPDAEMVIDIPEALHRAAIEIVDDYIHKLKQRTNNGNVGERKMACPVPVPERRPHQI
jgi:hypothetical protein